MELKWYAVYTRPRWEKKVAELFTKQKIENYCPLNRVERQWSDRKKIVLEPLFKSYVFIRIDSTSHVTVLRTDGVVNFVSWLGKPAVIRNEEIDVIKRFLKDHKNVRTERTEFHLKEKVLVKNGVLMSQEGSVLEIKRKTVKVLLSSLGFTLVAEIEKTNLEKAASQPSISKL